MQKAVCRFAIILVVSLFVQGQTHYPDSFHMEEPIRSPAKIPTAVFRQILRSDDNLLRVDETVLHFKSRISGTLIDLNSDKRPDFLVQGNDGANITGFWLFRNIKGRQQLVLYTTGLALDLLRHKHNGLRDIEAVCATAVTLSSAIYRFNGQKYRAHTCWSEDMGKDPGKRPKNFYRCSQ